MKEGKDCRRPNMAERKIKWRLEEIAREEERKENRVWRGCETEKKWDMMEMG